MKTLEERVVVAMDGTDKALYPYLPYILQDFWEIGSDPDVIISLIAKHVKKGIKAKVLDLGCGKGAVSVKIAKAFGFRCLGIDAVQAFVDVAEEKSKEYQVNELCTFKTADIREQVAFENGFDIIILGAIGPVLGSYFEMLKSLDRCLSEDGLIIIDDAYVDDDSAFSHPGISDKQSLSDQIKKAGMRLLEEQLILDKEGAEEEWDKEHANIIKRCEELSDAFPDKKTLFEGYVIDQQREYDVLKNDVICSTMVITRRL